MFILFAFVALFATARLFTSIWLQIWLDKGDGLEQERRDNLTDLGISNFTENEIKGYVTDNPDLRQARLQC